MKLLPRRWMKPKQQSSARSNALPEIEQQLRSRIALLGSVMPIVSSGWKHGFSRTGNAWTITWSNKLHASLAQCQSWPWYLYCLQRNADMIVAPSLNQRRQVSKWQLNQFVKANQQELVSSAALGVWLENGDTQLLGLLWINPRHFVYCHREAIETLNNKLENKSGNLLGVMMPVKPEKRSSHAWD